MKIPFLFSLVIGISVCAAAQTPQKQQVFTPDKSDPLAKPIQEPTPSPTPDLSLSKDDATLLLKIKLAEIQAKTYALAPSTNKEKANATSQLVDLYSQAVKSPNVVRELVGDALSNYYELKEGARGAAQVSQAADEAKMIFNPLVLAQNEVIIQQNQRIIALLEQLVRKR